jgi:UDP-GlcNAc:undecaprenyl-phosphate GlcNAc-1-phosphate transferase
VVPERVRRARTVRLRWSADAIEFKERHETMTFMLSDPALIGGLTTVAAMLVLRLLARPIGLLDHPGGHKRHSGVIPVIGGIAMFVGLAVALLLAPGGAFDLRIFLAAAAVLVTVGALDDAFQLSAKVRLIAECAAAYWMYLASSSGVHLNSFGDLFGFGVIDVSAISAFATVLVIVAGVNAFNMLDGLDGLAGGVALVALVLLIGATPHGLCPAFTQIALALIGCLVAFLGFNAPLGVNRRLRSFMGDAGSTLLGFSLATMMIGASQGVTAVATPITMGWLVLVPTTDMLWSVMRRLSRGQSPSHADNEHLHHLLMRVGLSSRGACLALILIALVAGLFGLALERSGVPEWLSLVLYVATGLGLVAFSRALATSRAPARAAARTRAHAV